MTDEDNTLAFEGFKVYAHGVGTVTPPKSDVENETEGE